jgi:peptidoglycan/LPS O-acetylase OafA/YrhL
MNDQNQQTQFFLINNFILPIPIAVLYYGLICEKSNLSRFLSINLIRLLGRTSYAFYLVHMIIIESVAIPFIAPRFGEYHNLYVLFVFILTQLTAYLIFTFYEQPINMFLRKKFT